MKKRSIKRIIKREAPHLYDYVGLEGFERCKSYSDVIFKIRQFLKEDNEMNKQILEDYHRTSAKT